MNIVVDNMVYAHAEIFAEFGNITAVNGANITNSTIKHTDILIVRSRTKINEQLLNGSSVKFVGSAVSGTDHVDMQYLADNNIVFYPAIGCNANAVAEFVIAACVNLATTFHFKLQTKTLGIIGVGNIGSILANKAQKLGVKTLLNDPIRQKNENLTNFVSLEEALKADIISFHTPLTKSGEHPTHNLVAQHNFHQIKDKAIMINAARGGIIDENIWQHKTNLINIIDCWENEPNINQKLQNSAYWATPHIAGHSIDAKFNGSIMVYKALCAYLKINTNKHIINLLHSTTKRIKDVNITQTINQIYSFIEDDKAIKNIVDFEPYRRNYPRRYEWHNFVTKIPLP